MPSFGLYGSFAIITGAALLVAALAKFVRQPAMFGYVLAGVLIGPFAPWPVGDTETVHTLAQFGVAFLLFGLGTQINLRQIKGLKGPALIGAAAQAAVMVTVPVALAPVLHLPVMAVGLMAFMTTQSGTAAIVKILSEREEMSSAHGKFALGVSIAQDLISTPILIMLPYLGGSTENIGLAVSLGMVKAVVVLLAFYIVGTRILPPTMERLARLGNELFLLAIVALAVGTAALFDKAGLSLAFGAYLAGMVVGSSHLNRHVEREVTAFRDVFAMFFFVSAGMVLDVGFVMHHVPQTLGILAFIVLGTTLTTGAVVLFTGGTLRNALLGGLALAHMGEFSFLLGQVGMDAGILSADMYSLALAGAGVSMAVNPLLLGGASGVINVAERWLGRHRIPVPPPWATRDGLSDRVVICGYTDLGRHVAEGLISQGIPVVVIERDTSKVMAMHTAHVPFVIGDPTDDEVLRQAGVARARAVAVAVDDVDLVNEIAHAVRLVSVTATLIVGATDDDLERLTHPEKLTIVSHEEHLGVAVLRHLTPIVGVLSWRRRHVPGTHRTISEPV